MGCLGINRKTPIISSTIHKKEETPKDDRKLEKKELTREEIVKAKFDSIIIRDKNLVDELNNTFLDDFERFHEEFEEFYKKFEIMFKKNGLLRKEVESFVIKHRTNLFIIRELQYKEWDCHKIIIV